MDEHEKPRSNHFFVDAKEYETEQTELTGLQIKAQAGVAATYQLFLETKGDQPDEEISDGQRVNLRDEPKHFFAVPPATFGRQ